MLFSASEDELFPLSVGVVSLATGRIMFNDERFAAFEGSIVLSGDCSVSDEDRLVSLGGGGDPSVFFERKPAWNRFALGLISIDGCGAVGIGDEPRESLETSAAR